MKIELDKFTFVPFEDDDMDEIFCSPVFNWIRRVPVWSYVRYYDKYVFKTDKTVLAAYCDNLDNAWAI